MGSKSYLVFINSHKQLTVIPQKVFPRAFDEEGAAIFFHYENDKLSQVQIKIRVCGHSLLYMVLNHDDKNINLFIAEGGSWAYVQKK